MSAPADEAALTAAWTQARRPGTPEVYALDLDGTLVEIAPHPDAIVVPPSLVPTLNALHQPPARQVVIISGRAQADVESHLAGFCGSVLGNHGAEQLGMAPPAAWRAAVDALAAQFPGLWLEDKGATWCIHWRAVDAHQLPALTDAVARLASRIRQSAGQHRYRSRLGHMALDIVPVDVNKGTALRGWLQAQASGNGNPPPLVTVMGDDTTDEEMFQAVEPTALTVEVGRREPTRARYRLDTPEDARRWLKARAARD